MVDKSHVNKELARRMCAAYVSHQMGVTVATQYKNTPEDVGDLWYFLAALAEKLVIEGQQTPYEELATKLIQQSGPAYGPLAIRLLPTTRLD